MNLPACAVALALLAATGCSTIIEKKFLDISTGQETAAVAAPGSSPGTLAADHYIEMRSKKADALGFIRLPRDLWPPFRYECTAGVFDASKFDASEGGQVCVELDGRATDPLKFFGMCGQILSDGINVYGYSDASVVPIASHKFDGAHAIDFAIEADGNTITLLARAVGDPSYMTIADAAYSDPTFALLPSFGVSGLDKKGAVGFDFLRVTSNGDPPAPTTLQQDAARAAWTAADPILEAIYSLDGGMPDAPASGLAIAAGLVALDGADAAVALLPESKKQKNAAKSLAAARKKLEGAGGALIDLKLAKALDRLRDAAEEVVSTAVKLDPED